MIYELNLTQICEVVLYRTEVLSRQDKIRQWHHNNFLKTYGFGRLYRLVFFKMRQYFWPHTVYIVGTSKFVMHKISSPLSFSLVCHRRSWHGPPPFFLTFCLQIYFQWNFFISLLFHLIFLILTCSCQYSYNLMLTSNFLLSYFFIQIILMKIRVVFLCL